MTRSKLIPWLAIPALLLLSSPALPNATAGTPEASIEETDGLIYLPMVGEPAGLDPARSLQTSTAGEGTMARDGAAGEVTMAQYGAADGNLANSNGLLAVRFDPPFNAPYTITGISFPTRTQFELPTKLATFISVRVVGMNATTGLPDKTIEYYQKRRVQCSPTGGMNTIPLSISGTPGQTFFAVFHFPRPPASGDTFPFLYTDRAFTERGLYANAFATDTSAAVRSPLAPGTIGRTIACMVDSTTTIQRTSGSFLADRVKVGDLVSGDVPPNTHVVSVGTTTLTVSNPVPKAKTTGPLESLPVSLGFSGTGTLGLLVDQNIVCSMTFQLAGAPSLDAPTGLGLELRATQVTWRFHNAANILADGTVAPRDFLTVNELVRRDKHVWTVVGTGGGGSEKITRAAVPGSGLQIWGVRSVDRNGGRSEVSNVTMSGASHVQGYTMAIGEDAQEPNGRASVGEATPLTIPVVGQGNTIWPAGDVDNYCIYAQSGQHISVRVSIPIGAYDNRNDLVPHIQLFDNSGNVVASAVGSGKPSIPVTLTHTAAATGNSTAFKHYIVQVSDKSVSDIDPGNSHRVLVPCGYNLSVDVTGPASSFSGGSGESGSGSSGGDAFAFANARANPVRGPATFNYVIPRSAQTDVPVRLRIYDVRGRVISTLVDGAKPAGAYFAAWSGHDVRGGRVASGPYFARLQAGPYSKTVRVDILN